MENQYRCRMAGSRVRVIREREREPRCTCLPEKLEKREAVQPSSSSSSLCTGDCLSVCELCDARTLARRSIDRESEPGAGDFLSSFCQFLSCDAVVVPSLLSASIITAVRDGHKPKDQRKGREKADAENEAHSKEEERRGKSRELARQSWHVVSAVCVCVLAERCADPGF